MYHAAAQFHADVIIRLTADCPLLDPEVVDLTVSAFLGKPALQTQVNSSLIPDTEYRITYPLDFAADRLPPPWKRTLPIGLDVEVCSFDALERAWKEAGQVYQREHVMPYLYEGITFANPVSPAENEWYVEHGTTPRGFRVALLNHRPDYGSLRWTVDTLADLEFVQQVYAHLDGRTAFGWQDVLALLQREPELAAINANVQHKTAFDVEKRPPRA
jgi:spore coat polysaccharide biosynthesis protein SpsF